MESVQPTQNTTQITNENVISNESSPNKIKLYEILMVIAFIIFAIPLYLFIFKHQSTQENNNVAIEIPTPTITPTPTPVLIKKDVDLNQIGKDLDKLDSQSIEGTISEINLFIESLLK